MPWRMVLFLLFLGVVVTFAGFNAGNATDISFGFHTLEAVPIFISLFGAFFLGVLIVLPFAMFRRSKKREKAPKEKKGRSRTSRTENRVGRHAQNEQTLPDGTPPAI